MPKREINHKIKTHKITIQMMPRSYTIHYNFIDIVLLLHVSNLIRSWIFFVSFGIRLWIAILKFKFFFFCKNSEQTQLPTPQNEMATMEIIRFIDYFKHFDGASVKFKNFRLPLKNSHHKHKLLGQIWKYDEKGIFMQFIQW